MSGTALLSLCLFHFIPLLVRSPFTIIIICPSFRVIFFSFIISRNTRPAYASIFIRLSYLLYLFNLFESTTRRCTAIKDDHLFAHHIRCSCSWLMVLWCSGCSAPSQTADIGNTGAEPNARNDKFHTSSRSIGIDFTYNPNNCIISDFCSVSFAPGHDYCSYRRLECGTTDTDKYLSVSRVDELRNEKMWIKSFFLVLCH